MSLCRLRSLRPVALSELAYAVDSIEQIDVVHRLAWFNYFICSR